MNKTKENTLQAILNQGVLPLYFEADAALSWEILKALYEAGIRVVEFTHRGVEAPDNFSFLKTKAALEMPDLYLGIGTIKTLEELNKYEKLGADFFVSPIIDLGIGNRVHEIDKLWIPGCFSPTEINLAYQAEAGLIKLFPANLLGPNYLSSIKDLFPKQRFMPTGGVDLSEVNINSWFQAGVSAVGLGSKLIAKDLIEKRDFKTLQERTRWLLNCIEAIQLKYVRT
ncbi:MAG: bifunctional 4-hydroxy-2-oxoglutarate aldolase/2-dehydro-3-deoxy-phosphogluconate aldolase [Pedobacter sp.]|nr:MAG: bifunctional 4-hydroxy-2-oxoglutarate aldolase/2-dehydro-3-deoxy-phosphogluconate aldolase [Pedobacter sp.]